MGLVCKSRKQACKPWCGLKPPDIRPGLELADDSDDAVVGGLTMSYIIENKVLHPYVKEEYCSNACMSWVEWRVDRVASGSSGVSVEWSCWISVDCHESRKGGWSFRV